eukprot:1161059-Pelagomonas_calceolata.AAC.8
MLLRNLFPCMEDSASSSDDAAQPISMHPRISTPLVAMLRDAIPCMKSFTSFSDTAAEHADASRGVIWQSMLELDTLPNLYEQLQLHGMPSNVPAVAVERGTTSAGFVYLGYAPCSLCTWIWDATWDMDRGEKGDPNAPQIGCLWFGFQYRVYASDLGCCTGDRCQGFGCSMGLGGGVLNPPSRYMELANLENVRTGSWPTLLVKIHHGHEQSK